MIRYNKRTDDQKYSLYSGIESWIEADPYFPRLFIKRPDEISETFPMRTLEGGHYREDIEKDESLFLDDILYNFFGDDRIDNEVKFQTIKQLRKTIDRIDGNLKYKIDEELFQAEQEAAYEDEDEDE